MRKKIFSEKQIELCNLKRAKSLFLNLNTKKWLLSLDKQYLQTNHNILKLDYRLQNIFSMKVIPLQILHKLEIHF